MRPGEAGCGPADAVDAARNGDRGRHGPGADDYGGVTVQQRCEEPAHAGERPTTGRRPRRGQAPSALPRHADRQERRPLSARRPWGHRQRRPEPAVGPPVVTSSNSRSRGTHNHDRGRTTGSAPKTRGFVAVRQFRWASERPKRNTPAGSVTVSSSGTPTTAPTGSDFGGRGSRTKPTRSDGPCRRRTERATGHETRSDRVVKQRPPLNANQ